MITLASPKDCCGCSACASACPYDYITMERDAEGFLFPVVDAHCLHCGLCNQVCPFENPPAEAPILGVYAAKSRSEKLRNASTSGGMFTVLAKPVIATEGGAVYGVVMNEDRKGCSFAKATFEVELGGMRRSKYVQADASGVYERVATDLRAGKQVLFVGAPCQVNALKLFLSKPFDNLLTVDFICHGVPSPLLWEKCVEDFEERAGALTFVNFRNKEHGWRKFGLLRRTEGGDDLEMVGESPYLNIFLRSYAERESCFECRAKMQRSSDITIADFWGIEDALPEFSDDLGVSLCIVHTERGEAAFKAAIDAELIDVCESTYEAATKKNDRYYRSVPRPSERDVFFAELEELGFAGVAEKYGAPGTIEP